MKLNQYDINISAPDLMCICVDSRRNSDIGGRIYHKSSSEPILFFSIAQMLKEMEQLCDRIGYPQAAVRSRTFCEKRTGHREKEAELVMETEKDILENNGEAATFVVHIQYRQNATWQGKVTWADKKKSCNFRSALELLKLIDSALEDEEQNEAGADE